MIFYIYIDDATEKRLRQISKEQQVDMEILAENAVSEAALNAFRGRSDDPGSHHGQS